MSTLRAILLLLLVATRLAFGCDLVGGTWKASLPSSDGASGELSLTFYSDGSQSTKVRVTAPECTCGCIEEGTWTLSADATTITIDEVTSTPTSNCCSCSSTTSVYSIVGWSENCNTITVSTQGVSLSFMRESGSGIFNFLPKWLPAWAFISICIVIVVALVGCIIYRKRKTNEYEAIN